MRLHELSVTAFGPFAATVEVDFDVLSEGGLFLLTGATGAGKTSILDAVCFALYGHVPGDRSGAKHLRSDHAAPQTVPQVVLRLSIGEREFLFTRSPSWNRPKLRGQGETRVQASVLVEERRDGTWTALTTRLDEAGQLVTELLGMTGSQFTQVAMLPQGRFQAFLRATSAERHAVLQQLFRTDRFERVERWLVDQRSEARRANETAAGDVLEVLNRLREAAATNVEPAWLDDLSAAGDRDEVTAWISTLSAEAAHLQSAAETASAQADDVLGCAAVELATAEHTARLQLRARVASGDLARIAARHDAIEQARDRLASHRRATPLGALAARATRAAHDAVRAEQQWQRLRLDLPVALAEEPSYDALVVQQRIAHDAHVLAVAFGPRDDARREARTRSDELRRALQSLESGIAEIDLTLSDQPAVINDAVAAVHEARAAAARLPVLLAKAEQLEALVLAARRAEVVDRELAATRTEVLAATGAAQQAKERHLDIREARINGMAGELAGQLASGCSCPVCGSATHPAPAVLDSTVVGRVEEERARKEHEDAAFDLQARKVGLATLESEIAGLDARLGDHDRAVLPVDLAAVRDEIERLEPLVAALDVLADREHACRARLREAEEFRAAALLRRAALIAEAAQAEAVVAGVDAEWDLLLGVPGAHPDEQPAQSPGQSLDQVSRLRYAQATALDHAVAAYDVWLRARDQAVLAADEAQEAAVHAGFATLDDASAAVLGSAAAEALTQEVDDADLTKRTAELTLADPEVAAALLLPEPELERLRAAHDCARARARTAASAHDAAATRSARLGELATLAQARLAVWGPLRSRHRVVGALASLVEGKSVDNPLRMRLAAYVLAERLKQVVAAANERLARMSDQRYALEHTDDRGYGEQRGGLSLLVRDDWNGVHRDPATLSGGETFVVSLALALGLADTVAHEAGGVDIDTLFIDEGFGSLDADTLEDVMDTLDSLRDGGRVVGLVSHVPELRSRITTQLEITKGRAGSTVRAAVADR
ncbi:MAG: family ATPase [Marmoricola sp.]|nr:family ATPase [Marmoricola sp.]